MATSGTITGLLFGFGTFLVTKILLNYEILYFSIASLIVEIILNQLYSICSNYYHSSQSAMLN